MSKILKILKIKILINLKNLRIYNLNIKFISSPNFLTSHGKENANNGYNAFER